MYVQADASQLEWRGALELSKEWVGINEIKSKADAHSLNQVAFELPSRLIAKIYLFRTIFRGSGWGFANDPDFMHVSSDPDYWNEVGVKFYKKYHNLDKKHFEWKDLVLAGKPIVGPLGREWKIQFDGLKIPWTVFTNYPVQGTCADIMLLARVIFRKRLRKETWGNEVLLVTSVHDSIIVDCPTYLVDRVVRLFYDCFAALIPNIKTIWGYDWETPLECECKIGMTMKGMKKIVPA
jgi:hypothetical protein